MKTHFAPSLLLTSGLLTLFSACQRSFSGPTPPSISSAPVASAPRTLRFGSGSTYTGYEEVYALQANGRLAHKQGFVSSKAGSWTTLKVPSGQARACFRRFDSLPIDSLCVEASGNHYYFLESQTASGQPVRVVWGAHGATAPRCVRTLHQQLQELVPLTL
ncbi:hypothetical protein F0P96_18765 [Hymenobacter busanensis]|uniref:Uncharacterized protein n=1 Tax=Hymenobacter busanensis TaxID=2607656 RepID=A0A7L4ZT95_9BACT|nr:hypothetical protein [Hymenobacter busanensis]KAA9325812.1 hypothetical protein F0P96_18765 [Hymenobacter busanensis]QHJ06348.1 hypothetical protein GUY19_03160 [Hymenobacter busanensis]